MAAHLTRVLVALVALAEADQTQIVHLVVQEIHHLFLLLKDKVEEMGMAQQHNTKQVVVVELVRSMGMLVVDLLELVEQE